MAAAPLFRVSEDSGAGGQLPWLLLPTVCLVTSAKLVPPSREPALLLAADAVLLAGVLVQFPATFHAGPEEVRRLGRIRSLLDPLPLVLEVRHRSWFEPPQLKSLGGLGYSVAHIDLPSVWDHPPARFRPTGPIGYLRLHGRNHSTWFRAGVGRDARYDYLYAPPEVGELVERADAISREVDETWVVTNNHFEGQAVANALELKWLLGGREPVAAPATLVEAFPHLESLTRSVGQQGMFGGDEG